MIKRGAFCLDTISPGNLDKLRRWRNDERLFKWFRQVGLVSEAHHAAWYESLQHNDSVRMFEIKTSSGCLIGAGGLTSIDFINRKAELSLFLGPDFADSPIYQDIIPMILDFGFNWLGLNFIWADVIEGCPNVERYHAAGFKDFGCWPDSYFKNGRFLNAYLMGIKRGDYV